MEPVKPKSNNGTESENVVDLGDIKATGPSVGLSHENVPGEERRPVWSSFLDFPVSLIGFTVNYSSFWLFPYLCCRHGGVVVFMVPYLIFLVLGVIPLYYMELALGQHSGKGVIAAWGSLNPVLKGIGYASVLLSTYFFLTESGIVALAVYYLISSFASVYPWTTCDNSWNTRGCYGVFQPMVYDSNLSSNFSSSYESEYNQEMDYIIKRSAAEEYFRFGLLGITAGYDLTDLGGISWLMVIVLLALHVICFFILWKGIAVFGKVMWFTALFPYPALLILLIRCITLPGAFHGMAYFVAPDFRQLLTFRTWQNAASYALFSLAPGVGVLITFAGYNRRCNRIYIDAAITSGCSALTGCLAGLVYTAITGYFAWTTGRSFNEVFYPSAFVNFVEGLSFLPVSKFWLILYFLMIICVEINSLFGFAECIVRAVGDASPTFRKHRWATLLILFICCFLIGLAFCTPGGRLVIDFIHFYSLYLPLPIIVLCEVLAVAWLYGAQRFSNDVNVMLGHQQPLDSCLKIFWKFITPILLATTPILAFINLAVSHIEYGGYSGPWWATSIGIFLALSSLVCIPAFALYEIITTYKGNVAQALRGPQGPDEIRNLQTYTVTTTTTITKTEPVSEPV